MNSTNTTLVAIPADLLARLRAHVRHADEEDELVEMVNELLAASPADKPGEHEYGFLTTLRGVLRVTDTGRLNALARLTEFQAVDCELRYDGVTLTEVSFIPDEVVLIDVDGEPVEAQQ